MNDEIDQLDPQLRQAVLDLIQDIERDIKAGLLGRAYDRLSDLRVGPARGPVVNNIIWKLQEKHPELLTAKRMREVKVEFQAAGILLRDAESRFSDRWDDLVRLLVSLGWKRYEFISHYRGSDKHPEVKNLWKEYWFAPHVDLSRWNEAEFAHGGWPGAYTSVSNWAEWLCQYTEGEDYFVRALRQ